MTGASFDAFGFASIQVNVNNGHTFLGVRANYKTVYLTPAETVTLTAKRVFTDNAGDTPINSGLTFSSDTPGVATVNAATGRLTGVAKGFANITITDAGGSGKTVVAKVLVLPLHTFPHLAKGKPIQTTYSASSSQWLRELYFYGFNAITQVNPTGDYAAAGRAAGVSAIEETIFFNPINIGSPATFADWQAAAHPAFTNRINIATSNGFGYYGIGDDVDRTSAELDNTLNGYGNKSLPDAFQYLAANLVGVTMIDEVNFQWGDTPTPPAGTWTGPPAIPNTAFVPTLMGYINSTPGGHAPLAWPASGTGGVVPSTNWTFNTALSNYADIYWSYVTDNRFVYPWGPSTRQAQLEQDSKLAFNRIDPAFVFIMGNSSIVGPGYTKVGNGSAEFTPGTDLIFISGQTPAVVTENIVYAAAVGAAGVRMYGFDDPSWKNKRVTATDGNSEQLFVDPYQAKFAYELPNWSAMSASFNVIKTWEPDFLSPMLNAPDLGPEFTTGARQGTNARLLIVLNNCECPRTVNVDFSPYRYPNAPSVQRVRLVVNASFADTIANTTSSTQTFEPGQAMIFRFVATGGTTGGTTKTYQFSISP